MERQEKENNKENEQIFKAKLAQKQNFMGKKTKQKNKKWKILNCISNKCQKCFDMNFRATTETSGNNVQRQQER